MKYTLEDKLKAVKYYLETGKMMPLMDYSAAIYSVTVSSQRHSSRQSIQAMSPSKRIGSQT